MGYPTDSLATLLATIRAQGQAITWSNVDALLDALGAGGWQFRSFDNLLKNGDFESWSGGTAVAPDRWTLAGAGATIARDGTNFKRSLYAAAVTRVGTDATLQQTDATLGTGYFQSRAFAFGAWVRATVASRARLLLADGVGTTFSSYHTGGGAWEWLTVTRKLDVAATTLSPGLSVDTGNTTAQIDGAICVEGDVVPAFVPHPNDQHLRINNYQTSAPANTTDQGVWRAEIGTALSSTSADVTVTFATAFRTARMVLLTPDTSLTPATAQYNTLGISSFKIAAYNATNGVRAPVFVTWLAVGQV